MAVCGRADGKDVVIDGMLWQPAGKSARYAGELAVPEPLDAVRRHQPKKVINNTCIERQIICALNDDRI